MFLLLPKGHLEHTGGSLVPQAFCKFWILNRETRSYVLLPLAEEPPKKSLSAITTFRAAVALGMKLRPV